MDHPHMNLSRTIRRASLATACVTCLVSVLSGCVTAPPPRPVPLPPPPPPRAANIQVFAYPLRGQPPEQQDRDHYECSQWATQQTGFDPSAPGIPPHDRVQVVSAGPPPGTNTAIGAFTGAVIGAAIGPRWNPAPTMLAGALVGGAIGSSTDAANAQANAQAAGQAAAQNRRIAAAQEQQASQYRRALSACLDGRGYSVK
jgi:hypothetical protein